MCDLPEWMVCVHGGGWMLLAIAAWVVWPNIKRRLTR